jgi:hypothetical protein
MKTKNETVEFLQKLTHKEKRIFKGSRGKEKRYSSKDNRYTEYLKNPERTHNDKDEWFIYVPSCFNDCLDIAKTERVNDSKKEMIWTQGSRFAFHCGCILYDTPKAYQNWANAVNEIKYCISVNNGKSASPAMNTEDRHSGEVVFSVFSPHHKSNNLNIIGEFTLSQDEFVKFLILGSSDIVPT